MNWILNIISGFILVVGIADDLRSRKIHNQLILFFIPLALLSVLVVRGPAALLSISLISGLVALLISIPLYSLKVIGGGDLKLYMAVSLTWDWNTCVWSFICALPISLVFGLLRIIFKGELKKFFFNIWALVQFQKIDQKQAQTFPFSVALFLGWLTYLVLEKRVFI